MLQVLAQHGNTVVALGPSTVGGVAVNGYSVTVNPSTVAQELKKRQPSGLDAAGGRRSEGAQVHPEGLRRQLQPAALLRDARQTSRQRRARSTIDETLDFSDYGAPVTVTAPPADQVESFEQFLQAAGARLAAATPLPRQASPSAQR